MRLALRELVRRPNRFVTAIAILTLIALLLLFLGGLVDGLRQSSTAALAAQRADAIVYSADSEASLQRSRIDPALRAQVEELDGVDETGGLGIAQLGARVPGAGPRDLVSVALFGYELPPAGVPEPPAAGEVYADAVLRADGVEEGMELRLGPARTPVTVAGFVGELSFNGQGSLWASPQTWREVLAANNPAAQLGDEVFQALLVRGGRSPADLVAAIDSATGGATETFTLPDAVEAIPGVSEQRSVFNQIIGVTIAIAVVVIAMFFALITVERTALYGVLKALGGRSRSLLAGLVLQAVTVTAVAVLIGVGLGLLIQALLPVGGIPLDISPARIVLSAVLMLAAAVIGCAFSLRRVLKVDPASAIGTAS